MYRVSIEFEFELNGDISLAMSDEATIISMVNNHSQLTVQVPGYSTGTCRYARVVVCRLSDEGEGYKWQSLFTCYFPSIEQGKKAELGSPCDKSPLLLQNAVMIWEGRCLIIKKM